MQTPQIKLLFFDQISRKGKDISIKNFKIGSTLLNEILFADDQASFQ
jgi:hypothetical protein